MKSSPSRLAGFLTILSLSPLLPEMATGASDVALTTAATSGGTFNGGNPNIFTPTASPAVANNVAIQTSLNAGTPVTLNTSSAAAGNGDLVTTATIGKTTGSSATSLTLNAVRDLAINGALSASVGGMPLVLNAGRAISSTAAITTFGGNVTINTVQPFSLGNSLNAGTGQILLQTGSLESAAAQTVTASSVQVAAGTSWKHRGTIAGNLSVSGTLSAGPAAGSLQVNGTLTLQPSATTFVDLAGTSQGSTYDSISATGAVTLAGALQLNFLSGFENAILSSSSFTIISGSSLTGTFSTLANNSRITLPNELGSVKITYNATNVVLSDWQPVIRDLTWDPGTTDAGTHIFNVPANNVGGRFYFRITSQGTSVGAWRTALRITGGTADVYLKQNAFPASASDFSYKSDRAGTEGDGFVVPSSAFGAAQTWYLMVAGSVNGQWSLVSGEAFVQDLGTLASDETSSSGNVQIGAEGHRFFRTTTPPAAAAWRVWLNDEAITPATLTSTKLAVRRTAVPMIDGTRDHQQLGHMLLVPPYLNTGGDTYFLAVSGTPGTAINLDSRSAAVTDVAFGSSTAFTLPTAGYAVYRTQVPIDQIGWQTELRGVSANVDLAVRRDNAASEWFNDAFSEVPGTVSDSVTLVPPTLTNGTYYMTIYNSGATATGTLVNRVPFSAAPDDVPFIGTSLNDEATTSADDANPNKAGWRYFRVGVADAQGISEQLGKFGWELSLAGEPANAEIALRRNFLPGKWLSRNAFGGGGQGSTYHQDFNSATGLLQRAGHQADIWYVGVYASASALGNFSLSRTEIIPPVVLFANGSATMTAQPAGTWRYFTVEVPNDAALLGWDLRTTGVTGNIAMNLSRGGAGTDFGAAEFWTHPKTSAGEFDFDRYLLKAMEPQGTGAAQLRAGTYYINIYNASSQPQSYTVQSRGIGTVASAYPLKVQPLAFANGTATFTNLPAREVAFYSVEVPAGAKTWSVKSVPDGAGELTMMGRQGILPQTSYAGGGDWLLNKPGQEMLYMGASGPSGSLVAGTYYLAVASAGTSPSNWERVGTGNASGTISSVSEMPVTVMGGGVDIGTTEQTQQVALAFGEVKLYRFTVAPGTLSLEVRLANRTANPIMTLAAGEYPGFTNLRLHQYSVEEYINAFGPTSAASWDLITVPNPAPGIYTVAVRAARVYGGPLLDATATLGVVANVAQPVAFANGSATMTAQPAGTWRYFKVVVPNDAALLGWDLRTTGATGSIAMDIDRDTPRAGTGFAGGAFWTHPNTNAGEGDPNRYLLKTMEPQGTQPGNLRAGTFYVSIYNSSAQPVNYTVQSRGIGTVASAYPLKVQPLALADGTATFTNLPAREVAFYSVDVPTGVKTWSIKGVPDGAGELTMMGRNGFLPERAGYCDWLVNKPGQEMVYLGATGPSGSLAAGTYYLVVASAGTSPFNGQSVGTGRASGTISSVSEMPVTVMGGGGDIDTTEQTQAVALAFGEVKLYRFTVAPGTLSLEVRLANRTGNPLMSLAQGEYPGLTNLRLHSFSVEEYINAFGPTSAASWDLITVPNPAPGIYTVGVRAARVYGGPLLDAAATLGVVAKAPTILNFSSAQNGSGGTNVDTTATPVIDGTRNFYQITVPATVNGAAPLGWKLSATTTQGAASLYVHRDASNLGTPVAQTAERSLILAPPVFSPGTYMVEVRASGATSYTLTSEAVVSRNSTLPWVLPTVAAYATADDIGDSGQLDLANGDYDFYTVTVPEGNAGILRTVIEAISGNPDLYIRRISIPSHNHTVQGPDPDQTLNEIAYSRALTHPSGTEYGNWVPYHQKAETQLRPGTYYLAVHAASNTNLRYRLRVSPGAIQSLALDGGNVSNQLLTGGDWRYYKVELPADATMPQSWQMTFAQNSGDAIMFLRDTVPPGLKNTSTVTTYGDATMDWQREAKNANTTQYSRYDNPGSYTLTTPPLRPGTSYYVGVYAKNDSSFSLTSSKSGNIEATTPLDFYTGTVATSIPGNSSVIYQISAPTEATRLKWTSTHASTVQLRLEQGSLPATTGTVQHYYSSGANSSRNTALATTWPWLPNQNYYLRIVNNSATAAPVTLAMDGENAWIGSDAYSNWASGTFSSSQLANQATSGGMADPDGDGIANQLEFLLGGNPTGPDPSILPTLTATPVTGGQTLVFRYKRKLSSTGVSQLIEHSPDLSTIWMPAVHGQNGVTIVPSPVDATTEQVTVTIPTTGISRFVRLKIVR